MRERDDDTAFTSAVSRGHRVLSATWASSRGEGKPAMHLPSLSISGKALPIIVLPFRSDDLDGVCVRFNSLIPLQPRQRGRGERLHARDFMSVNARHLAQTQGLLCQVLPLGLGKLSACANATVTLPQEFRDRKRKAHSRKKPDGVWMAKAHLVPSARGAWHSISTRVSAGGRHRS
jgi:hypothetical protein